MKVSHETFVYPESSAARYAEFEGCARAVIGRVVSAHLKIWRETTIFYTLIEVSGRMAEYLACVQLTIWAERANPNKKLEFPPPVFNFF